MVAGLKGVHSLLKLGEDKLTTSYNEQTKTLAQQARLRTKNANKTTETAKFEFAAIESERPAKRTHVVCRTRNSLSVPSTAAHLALLAVFDNSKHRREVLVLENQRIPGLDKEAMQLCAKIAVLKKANASSRGTPARRGEKKHATVAKKHVVALEAGLKEAQNAQKQSTVAARESKKGAIGAAAQTARSFYVLRKLKRTRKGRLVG